MRLLACIGIAYCLRVLWVCVTAKDYMVLWMLIAIVAPQWAIEEIKK